MRRELSLSTCVAAAALLLFVLPTRAGDCPGDGNCCVPNGTPGCDDVECCEAGCANDPFCCSVSWDQTCVDFAVQNCDESLCVPSNDECADAIEIFDGETAYDSTFATDSVAPELCPNCEEGFGLGLGGDVWFSYTPTCTGTLTVSTCDDADYDTRLAAYATCPTEEADLIACNDDGPDCTGFSSIMCVPVTQGEPVLLRIGGFNGATGTGTVTLTCGAGCTPVDLGDCSPPEPPPSIATGDDANAEGYLRVAPDAYGAWASATFGGGGDEYNPAGTLGPEEAAFTSGFFLFTATQRELLSDSVNWQLTFPDDTTLEREITAAVVASDSSGNGVDDTSDSSFRVFGGLTDLSFDVHQEVAAGDSAQSVLVQDYTITNDGAVPVSFDLVRSFDGDFVWVGGVGDDEVGTSTNGADNRFVAQQESGNPATAVTISSCDGDVYWGGKQGVDPGMAGLPYGVGTDIQVWDAFGVPVNWENHIAGVGYDTNGFSGPAPPGSTPPTPDAFCGLTIPVSLDPGASTTVTIVHTYGNNEPALGCDEPNPCADADTNGSGSVAVDDLTNVILQWGTDGQGTPGVDADVNNDGTVNVSDLVQIITFWGCTP